MNNRQNQYRYRSGALLTATVGEKGLLSLKLQSNRELLRIEMPHHEIVKFVEFILPNYVELIGNNGPQQTVVELECKQKCPYKKYQNEGQIDSAGTILKAVLELTNISLEELRSKKKTRDISLARSLFFYLARQQTTLSLSLLGTMLNKHYSTVILSVKSLKKRREINPEIDRMIKKVESLIKKKGTD